MLWYGGLVVLSIGVVKMFMCWFVVLVYESIWFFSLSYSFLDWLNFVV